MSDPMLISRSKTSGWRRDSSFTSHFLLFVVSSAYRPVRSRSRTRHNTFSRTPSASTCRRWLASLFPKSTRYCCRYILAFVSAVLFVPDLPTLPQGPTSAGKTSMVEYLAKRTGHRFVRINNHEHTDLQEYLGTYVTDPHGKLVFQEGVLVEAVRKVQERGSMTVSASRFPIILLGLLGSTRRT